MHCISCVKRPCECHKDISGTLNYVIKALECYRRNVERDTRLRRALLKEGLYTVYGITRYLEFFYRCLKGEDISPEYYPERVICDEDKLISLYSVHAKCVKAPLGHPDIIIVKIKGNLVVIEERRTSPPSPSEFQRRIGYTYQVLEKYFHVKAMYIYFIEKDTAIPRGYHYDESGFLYAEMYRRRPKAKRVYFKPPVVVVSKSRLRQLELPEFFKLL